MKKIFSVFLIIVFGLVFGAGGIRADEIEEIQKQINAGAFW